MTNDDQPSNRPSAVDRPLTEDERDLLRQLAIWTVAEDNGIDAQAAAEALDDLVEREGIVLQGDAYEVFMRLRDASGPVVVHTTREWLDWWAHLGQQLTREDLLQSRGQRPPRDIDN